MQPLRYIFYIVENYLLHFYLGINTNKSEFPEDIKEIATSIKQEYKINIDKYEFVSEFCNKFEEKLNERIKKI